MHDHQKSKAQLIEELNQVRQQLESVRRSRGRMLEELEQGVKQRTAELARTNQRLTREIRERKHAETTLQESEERFRSLVETTSDFIFELDAEGVYTYVNPKAKDLTGYEPEELVGKSTFELMPADDARRNAALFRETVARGIPVPRAEVARLHKDGRRIIYETSCTPILDSAGQCSGYRGISRDITERKKAEEAIRKERHQLRRSLEASDQQRKLIAYEIHDGLTQHLSAAIMQFQTFSRLQPKDPEEAAKIYDVGMRMLGQSLSEARRLITGVRPPLLDDAGVVAAIENLIYEIASRGTETEIDFRCNVEFDRLEPALENGIYRIVQESLANLCRHANSQKARVELSQIEDRVRVVIRDWGIGFDPQRVSEKCYGLAGIRERARVLGGLATIQSTPGEGTKITVELSLIENRSALPPDRGPLQRRDDFV